MDVLQVYIMVMLLCMKINPSMEVRFQTEPQEIVEGEEGSSTILACIVTDLDKKNENVTWKVNGDIISNGSLIINEDQRDKYSILTAINDIHHTNNLMVKNIERSDGKNSYICAVTSKLKKEIKHSQVAKIKVFEKPGEQYPKCINLSNKKKYKEGETLKIECISENSQPNPKLTWNRQNKMLKSHMTNIKNILRITYNMTLTRNDNGAIYWCQLRIPDNPKFERNCSIGPFQVDYKPSVQLNIPKYAINEEAIFVCFSSASPSKVMYNWTIIPPIREYGIENNGQVLRLSRVLRSHEGTIVKCNVHNEVGQGSDETVIIIDDEDSDLQDYLPETSQNSNEQNQAQYTELPAATILSVAGASLLLLSLIMAILLCYFQVYTRSHAIDYTGQRIPQPDVYFEPKDSLHSPFAGEATPWKRSVGVQVSGDSSESSYTYAEIEERMKQRLSA
ncbi:uncharacterized protein LOC117115262 [Anneissia japonica]|uniref:uncharacterized protein LOC117115262 n=1 Tax=Anneissia japonica TaxID=1529436 RepID=UPI001425BAFB|nr:uncharacterized protein LOC117115262 [Anneissia japonica]